MEFWFCQEIQQYNVMETSNYVIVLVKLFLD